MEISDKVWQRQSVSERYLEGVRAAIPLAREQIDVLLRVLRTAQPNLRNFLDLGCGDGLLGCVVRERFPLARAVFLDFSEPMLQKARERAGGAVPGRTEFVLRDFGEPGWVEAVRECAPFAAVISRFAIHHQPDARKREIYRELHDLLAPGGIFLNLEHVSSNSEWVERIYDELFIDILCEVHDPDGKRSREEIANEYYYRPDKEANILAPIDTQCQWLRELGFAHVDCYLKIFELALFGGVRPG